MALRVGTVRRVVRTLPLKDVRMPCALSDPAGGRCISCAGISALWIFVRAKTNIAVPVRSAPVEQCRGDRRRDPSPYRRHGRVRGAAQDQPGPHRTLQFGYDANSSSLLDFVAKVSTP